MVTAVSYTHLVRFETEVLDMPNFQGNAAVNYTDRETPWTLSLIHICIIAHFAESGK